MSKRKQTLILVFAALILASLAGLPAWLHLHTDAEPLGGHRGGHETPHDTRNCSECQLYLSMAAEEPQSPPDICVGLIERGLQELAVLEVLPAAPRYLLPPSRAPPLPF